MQGVLTKRHILAHPLTVIRCFGMSLFWDVLRAPAQATFLEIMARHEFRQERGVDLKLAGRVDRQIGHIQGKALALGQFNRVALELWNQLDELAHNLDRLRRVEPLPVAGVADPSVTRFRGLLTALVERSGPVQAALGTLSPSELIAVEERVLRQAQKRCVDEVEQRVKHADTQIELIEAHLVRLFHGLAREQREYWRKRALAGLRARLSDDDSDNQLR